ncbi:terminase large subunit [Hoeflea sp.]|uniref:terminase large subunit n=1 Tax=Hoeflea sp. TaxID=1940281 RepID=UPI003B528F82
MKARRPTWIFDGSEIPDPHGHGQRAVDFITALKHPKSPLPDKAFQLPFFWERIIRRIYGPTDQHGNRKVKTAFMLLPRGARKTTVSAAMALNHTFGYQRIHNGQALAAASSEDQATIAYEEAAGIVDETSWLKPHAKALSSTFHLTHPKSRSVFRAISSDGGGQLGKTPNFVIADELIAWPKRDLWAALRTGLVKVPGSLLLVITQAGAGSENLAAQMLDYARKVEAAEIEDEGFLPVLFETLPGADWRSEKLWHFVNPGLAEGFPDLAGLRQLAKEAEALPAQRREFCQYNLNQWQEHSHAPFIEMETYDRGNAPIDVSGLEGRPCWIGVDMALRHDLCAIVAAFRDGPGFIVVAWFFTPEENILAKSERDKVDYLGWSEAGFIIPTPGPVINHKIVADHLRTLAKTYDVQEIDFDPNRALDIMHELADDRLPVFKFDQSWRMLVPAIDTLTEVLLEGRMQHGGNPVLRWCFENIAMTPPDRNGNMLFSKAKSRDRIDGASAALMAIQRAAMGELNGSFYDRPMAADPKWHSFGGGS